MCVFVCVCVCACVVCGVILHTTMPGMHPCIGMYMDVCV